MDRPPGAPLTRGSVYLGAQTFFLFNADQNLMLAWLESIIELTKRLC